MGIVYVGEQQMGSTVRKVAIKTLHSHLSKDPAVLARFHRECGTVAQLEHPNTIKFYDFGATADGTLYIAMEFVSGKPLADVVLEGPDWSFSSTFDVYFGNVKQATVQTPTTGTLVKGTVSVYERIGNVQ